MRLKSADLRDSYAARLRKCRGVLTLSKSVRLRSAELGASSFHLCKAALTCIFVFGGIHLYVRAKTVVRIRLEEGAVATVKDVDFRI